MVCTGQHRLIHPLLNSLVQSYTPLYTPAGEQNYSWLYRGCTLHIIVGPTGGAALSDAVLVL